MSWGIEVRPAIRMIAEKGKPRQTLTIMIAHIAVPGPPSQLGGSWSRPRWTPAQLMTL
jgi:hypothetical protein